MKRQFVLDFKEKNITKHVFHLRVHFHLPEKEKMKIVNELYIESLKFNTRKRFSTLHFKHIVTSNKH